MTIKLQLQEYQEAVLPGVSQAEAAALAAQAGDAVSVSLGSGGEWRVKANSLVGGLDTREVSLLVRPKVDMANVFEMLGVDSSSHRFLRETMRLETARDLLIAVVRMFVEAVEQAQRRGILRGYVTRSERLRALRGRIDFNGMLRQAGIAVPVASRYDDFTRDVQLNRYVLAALVKSARVPVLSPGLARRIQRARAGFEGVIEGSTVDVDWGRDWTPTQLDRHWESAVRLAEIVLRNLTLRDRVGDSMATAFFVNMNELFETWLTRELTSALAPDLRVEAQYPMYLGVGRTVSMRPDIVVTQDGVPVAVADVKYKRLDGEARNPDYYQALAYATSLGLPRAVLLYALVPGAEAAAPVVVHGSGVVLEAVGLRLGEDEGGLSNAVQQAAEALRAACRVSAASISSSPSPIPAT